MSEEDNKKEAFSGMKKEDLIEKKHELTKKIKTLEWDLSKKQIHLAHENKLTGYKKELDKIEDELNKEV